MKDLWVGRRVGSGGGGYRESVMGADLFRA